MTLKRDHRGLGFSIAGGRGATPFKNNDSVSLFIRVELKLDLILCQLGRVILFCFGRAK